MDGLFLRVAIDKGTGKILSPIAKDGRFEYLPIPEYRATKREKIFKMMIGDKSENVKVSGEYFPDKYLYSHPHLDPEFEKYTYGDPTGIKRKQLSKLDSGDLLIFYAGMEPYDEEKGVVDELAHPRLHIMGYFTVNEVIDFRKIDSKEKREDTLEREDLSNNAHVKIYKRIRDLGGDFDASNLVIVKGDPGKSKIFDKALPLGNEENELMEDLIHIFGYEGSILRSVGHNIWDEKKKVKNYLEEGIPSLVENGNSLYSYVLDSDTGFAPNITGSRCTLACCKQKIRKKCKEGDWMMGTLPKKEGRNRIAYLMRVNDVIEYDEYFRDDRFQYKKPEEDPDGDNIYYKERGEYKQLENNHHNRENMAKDLKSKNVLIGSIFWYFGENAPELPSKFTPRLVKKYTGHKAERDQKIIKELVEWISSNYRIGIHGSPRDKNSC